MNNFQRDGSSSNTTVGREFEERARKVLAEHGLRLKSRYGIPCGLDTVRKSHAFDLGSETPKVIVECKSHTWTSGGNVPSAKLNDWVKAMSYFHLAPCDYRKIFLVERSVHPRTQESLMSYFLRTQAHMVPADVECWELDGDELIVHEFRART